MVTARTETGAITRFPVRVRLETPREHAYLRHGGVLPYALRTLLRSKTAGGGS
jgi:aconitate hydratase